MAAVVEEKDIDEKKIAVKTVKTDILAVEFLEKDEGADGSVFSAYYMNYDFSWLVRAFEKDSWANDIAYVIGGSRVKLTHMVAKVLDIADHYVVLSNEREKGCTRPKPLYCFKLDKESSYYVRTELDASKYAFVHLGEKYNLDSDNDVIVETKENEKSEQKSNFFKHESASMPVVEGASTVNRYSR